MTQASPHDYILGARILITGGAGYIGSVLVPQLVRDFQYKVTVLDTFTHGENSLAMMCGEKNFEVIKGDCRDTRILKPLIDKADVIIALAGIVGAPACAADTNAATSTNFGAIASLCNYSSPSQYIIMPNTNSGYGSSDVECTEETPLKPLSLYARTKCEAEERLMQRERSISLRLATVFGASPRMRLDLLVNDFVYRAVTDRAVVLFESHFRRNYVHVKDIATAFRHCITNFPYLQGNVYNVGDTRANLTKAQLCAKIKEHIPGFTYFEAPVGEDSDKRDYEVSNAKFEKNGMVPKRVARRWHRGIAEALHDAQAE